MTPLLFISALLASCFVVDAQSACKTPSGGFGECKYIYQCQELLVLLRDPSSRDMLRNSICGYEETTPKVCCPKKDPPAAQCTSADGKPGTCVSVYSCAHIIEMFKQKKSLDFVAKSRCQGTDQYSVCCGPAPASGGGVAQPNIGGCQLTAQPPDPATACCGVDSSIGLDNRILGGNNTSISQYPWLSVIEYVKKNSTVEKKKLLCGGVLISGKYVMTARHCVVGHILEFGTPVNVRLGEYDTSNSGPDCAEVEGGGKHCTHGAVVIPIEKTIPYPKYSPISTEMRHDIALLRLARLVEYTDFIRPICLPSADFTLGPQTEVEKLFAAGWGAVNETHSASDIKQHVDLPFVTLEQCQRSFSVPGRRVQLWEGQMCAGGALGKDACKGDSGGPLMRENGRLMELVGIVSFGTKPCGLQNVPGVYTKVYHYLPWIRSQIEP